MTTPKLITGAQTRIAIVAEVTAGTTPASPTMLVLPYVKADLELALDVYEDTSVFADRMEHDVITGLKKVTGSLEGNLSASNFKPLLQTALFNTFSSNVLKVGTALQTVTIEEWHGDATTPFGRVATGCFFDKLQFKMQAKGIVVMTGTINGMALTDETAVLGTSYTAAVTEVPFTCVAATTQEGGSATSILTALDISIDNKSSAVDVIGSVTPQVYVPGMCVVTGTASFYIPNKTLYDKFLNSTQTSLSVQLTDGTNTITINLPNITYTSVKMPSQGQAAIIGQFAFKAVKDPSTGSNIVITTSE